LLKKPVIHKITDGEYIHIPDFYDLDSADSYFKDLIEGICWTQEKMHMFGREINFPRLMAFYGDAGKSYSFSKNTFHAKEWTPTLLKIKTDLESKFQMELNSVLMNQYRDGNDSMDWHQDDEKELGLNPTIVSVNFGASRMFQLRHLKTKEKINIPLEHGSVLIMKGSLQHHWQHRLPKTKKAVGHRINLTFRLIQNR